jgi:hypothetical protein
MSDPMDDLRHYLQRARETLVWKLDGLSEYDIRRPLVPTGTNLLGLVKHTASVEAGYLGDTFGRPFPVTFPWMDDAAELNSDMWATADESRDDVVGLYHRVWEHSDETLRTLGPDAPGTVPWWPPDHRAVTLHRVLVHVIAETQRHAGHADIVRELIDGATGMRKDVSNLPPGDAGWWAAYRDRLQTEAEKFRG